LILALAPCSRPVAAPSQGQVPQVLHMSDRQYMGRPAGPGGLAVQLGYWTPALSARIKIVASQKGPLPLSVRRAPRWHRLTGLGSQGRPSAHLLGSPPEPAVDRHGT
jgi:hypothetical protein